MRRILSVVLAVAVVGKVRRASTSVSPSPGGRQSEKLGDRHSPAPSCFWVMFCATAKINDGTNPEKPLIFRST